LAWAYDSLDEHGKEVVTSVAEIEYKRCQAAEAERQRQAAQAVDKMEAAEEIEPEPNNIIELDFNNQKASAGSGFYLDYERMERWKVQLNEWTRKADFCVEVEGRSMEPKFYDGDIILVRQQPSIVEGEIGLFTVNDRGYVKKKGQDRLKDLYFDGGWDAIEEDEPDKIDLQMIREVQADPDCSSFATDEEVRAVLG